MSSKGERIGIVILLASIVLAGMVVTAGCKEKPQPPPPTKPAVGSVVATEQTTCPVMGGKINKDIFTEYKGKKVYFCCAGCKEQFEKEPEKYIAKLPQFKN